MKEKVWKSKLQTCPEPSKVGYIIYSVHIPQVHDLAENLVTDIERENGETIETAFHSEVYFQNEEDRRSFFKTYNVNDEYQRISHNHRKLTTIYCAPKYRNLLAINLLSNL